MNPQDFLLIYRILLGIFILHHTIVFYKMGMWFKKDDKRFLPRTFFWLTKLPTPLHNFTLFILLPLTGIGVLSGIPEVVIASCFIATTIFLYGLLFCYLSWRHDLFLTSTFVFLSGMLFAFPNLNTPIAHPIIFLFAFQNAICYFFSGVSKARMSYFKDWYLVNSMLPPFRIPLKKLPFLLIPFNVMITVLEIGIGILIILPQYQFKILAFILGTIFHICMFFMTRKGRTFHFFMPATYLLLIIPQFQSFEPYFIILLPLIFLAIATNLLLMWGHYINEAICSVSMYPKKTKNKKIAQTPPLIFYDGDCGLCSTFVQFVLKFDKKKKSEFAPLQGITAKNADITELNTIVLKEEKRTSKKSTAVLRIVLGFGGVWKISILAFLVPRLIRDAVYDFVAKRRKKLFPKSCVLPNGRIRE